MSELSNRDMKLMLDNLGKLMADLKNDVRFFCLSGFENALGAEGISDCSVIFDPGTFGAAGSTAFSSQLFSLFRFWMFLMLSNTMSSNTPKTREAMVLTATMSQRTG